MTQTLTLSDFPDRLSPMVVKELRQGMRTRVFAIVMLTLHLVLVLLTLLGGGGGNSEIAHVWFDGVVTLVLCIILPLRGFSAVADEIKAGTLDMLALTRLSPWRIVFGKWLSIAAQSLLIALSILPYVVARYVHGGLDLFGEMLALGGKTLAGLVLAAFIVALSTQRNFWLRLLVVGLPMLLGGCGMMSFLMMSRMGAGMGTGTSYFITGPISSGMAGGAARVLLVLALAAWAVFYFLSLAATRIAPAAALLSVPKRLVHLLAIGIAWAVTLSQGGDAATAGGLLGFIMLDALTEPVNTVPSVYAAFYRRGLPGRLGLWLLAPGWVTGFFFTALLAAGTTVLAFFTGSAEQAMLVLTSACGTWMVAALVQFLPRARRGTDLFPAFLVWWLVLSVALSWLGGLLVMSHTMKSTTPWFTCALPQMAPLGYAVAQAGDKAAFLRMATLAALAWPLVLLVPAAFAWRRAREARQEARLMTNPEGTEA